MRDDRVGHPWGHGLFVAALERAADDEDLTKEVDAMVGYLQASDVFRQLKGSIERSIKKLGFFHPFVIAVKGTPGGLTPRQNIATVTDLARRFDEAGFRVRRLKENKPIYEVRL
jgi:hypothetical protein